MTTREFIEEKNAILFNLMGIQLVPDEQIVDLDPQLVGRLSIGNDAQCCPYCSVYGARMLEGCKGCPIYDRGNDCNTKSSTYWRITRKVSICDLDSIEELVARWNKAHRLNNTGDKMNIVFLHVNKNGLQKRTASHSKAWKSYDEDKVYPKGVFQIDLDTNTFKGINVRASYWDAEEFVEKVSTYQQLINQLEKAGYKRSA